METINGYPIIAQFHFEKRGISRAGRVIIVDRGAERAPDRLRFVTSCNYQTDGVFDKEWSQGGYYNTLGEAYKDFVELTERYAMRYEKATATA